MNCISYSKTKVNKKKKGFKMSFLMKKSKGASKTNLIFNVCICAIKSLHMYRLGVSTCLLTNTSGCEQVPGCAGPADGAGCVSIQSVPVQGVHIPQGQSALNPLTPNPCLPGISRGTNAIVRPVIRFVTLFFKAQTE